MELFLEFIGQQWMLVMGLMLMVAMLIFHENQKGGATVTSQQLVALMNKENAVVVDLRDAADFRAGHITDATNIPYNKFSERLSELEKYKSGPIVLVCKYGQHTGSAGKMLRAAGYENVYRLGGGMSDWQANNFPLVKA